MDQMAAQGWVCVAINYRLAPRDACPAHIVDVKRAIAWIKEHIADYGGDPDYLVDHRGSAGGHLAALAALTPGDPTFQPGFEDADTSVQAAVPFYGVYDFAGSTGLRNATEMRDTFLGPRVMQSTLAGRARPLRGGLAHPAHHPRRPGLLRPPRRPTTRSCRSTRRGSSSPSCANVEEVGRLRRAARRPARVRHLPARSAAPTRCARSTGTSTGTGTPGATGSRPTAGSTPKSSTTAHERGASRGPARARAGRHGLHARGRGLLLHRWARERLPHGPVLEVGTYCGKSAIYLGAAAREVGGTVFTVDHHRGSEENQAGWEHHDPDLVDAGARPHGHAARLPPHPRRTPGSRTRWSRSSAGRPRSARCGARPLSLVFIDGGHAEEHAARPTTRGWAPWLVHRRLPGHPRRVPRPCRRRPAAVRRFYLRALASGDFEEVEALGSMRVLRRTSRRRRRPRRLTR